MAELKNKVNISKDQKRSRNTKQSSGLRPQACWALEQDPNTGQWTLCSCGVKCSTRDGAEAKFRAGSQGLRRPSSNGKQGWPYCAGLGKAGGGRRSFTTGKWEKLTTVSVSGRPTAPVAPWARNAPHPNNVRPGSAQLVCGMDRGTCKTINSKSRRGKIHTYIHTSRLQWTYKTKVPRP